MAQYDEAAVRERLMTDLAQLERDMYARTVGDQAVTPSEGEDGTGLTSEQNDEATALSEYDRNQAMLDNDRALLGQIKAALHRLDAGTYGICEKCGKAIDPRRLAALPYVTLCLDDQELLEKRQGANA